MDGKLYSVIVRFGYLGVSFNTEVVSHEEAMDYDILWHEKLTGKVGHFDWHLPNLGCLSLRDGNNDPGPFDIGADQWAKLQETTLSLKTPGRRLLRLRWDLLVAQERRGPRNVRNRRLDHRRPEEGRPPPVDSVVPKQGGIQWTESYSIGVESARQDSGQGVHFAT